MVSVEPPGPKPMVKVIGPDGFHSACTEGAARNAADAKIAAAASLNFMVSLPNGFVDGIDVAWALGNEL
jgi:hypothetical protein